MIHSHNKQNTPLASGFAQRNVQLHCHTVSVRSKLQFTPSIETYESRRGICETVWRECAAKVTAHAYTHRT